jgi:hypothetical protein
MFLGGKEDDGLHAGLHAGVLQQVDLGRLVRRVLHLHLADLGAIPVVGVLLERDAAEAEAALLEAERAGADGLAGELVLAADGRFPRSACFGHDLEQESLLGVGDGAFEGDVNAVLPLRGHLADEVELALRVEDRLGILGRANREDDILGREGLAVVPLHALTQDELDAGLVVVDLPRGGQALVDITAFVHVRRGNRRSARPSGRALMSSAKNGRSEAGRVSSG